LSRIGKKPIPIPTGVEVKIAGHHVTVKGPKGVIEQTINSALQVKIDNNEIVCSGDINNSDSKSLWGLSRVLLSNMIQGVTVGFKKVIEIQGVGYKADMKGKDLNIAVGYSHPVIFEAVDGISFKCETPTKVSIEGIDKQLVGQITAQIRDKRSPEPYKGKGIRYIDEHVRRKVGKAAGK